MTRFLLASVCLLAACIDTGAEPTTTPLSVAGTGLDEPVIARRDIPVTLERADLAFGPLTLCAGFQAGDNCDSALTDWSDAAVVDTLDPAAVQVGELTGISGSARSFMYDLGFVSLLTSTTPLALPAATSLGGASYVIEGVAEVDGVEIPFSARAALTQNAEVERGIPIVRSPAGSFALELSRATPPITLRFNPAEWVGDIDFGVLVQEANCTAGAEVVCDGQLEQRCEEDGSLLSTTDCTQSGEVCMPNVGCVDRIAFGDESQALSAIRTALLSQTRPTFE